MDKSFFVFMLGLFCFDASSQEVDQYRNLATQLSQDLRFDDAKQALVRIQSTGEKDVKQHLPGLLGAAYWKLGNTKAACDVYRTQEKRGPQVAVTPLWYRLGVCAKSMGQKQASVSYFKKALADSHFSLLYEPVMQMLPVLFSEGQLEFASPILSRFLNTNLRTLASEEKERLSVFLQGLLQSQTGLSAELRLQIMARLYVDLAGSNNFAWPSNEAKMDQDVAKMRVTSRLLVLDQTHQVDALLAQVGELHLEPKDDSPWGCSVRYLEGKSYRKKRDYQRARKVLTEIVDHCQDPVRMNAEFLLTRLVAMQPAERDMAVYDDFNQRYGSASFADDALYYKASAQLELGQKDKAKATLEDLTQRYGQGDMMSEAVFRLAMLYIDRGELDKAIGVLDRHKDADPLRFAYWKARLSLFGDPKTLLPTRSIEDAAAVGELVALARDNPANYYGYLAKLLLERLKIPTPKEGMTAKKAVVRTLWPTKAKGPLEDVQSWLSFGYVDEAMWLLKDVSLKAQDDQAKRDIYQLSAAFGYPEVGFRWMKQLQNPRVEDLYPRAFEGSVDRALQRQNLPKSLVFAIMREESAFDATVVSWAGAIGLCQLMPEVAKDFARRSGLKDYLPQHIYNPDVNVFLGAAHLAESFRKLGHPLLVVAAYNAGEANVQKWLVQRSGLPLDTFVERIPYQETRNYVRRVATSWLTYDQLAGLQSDPFGMELK